jgi:chromosome segregation ATPase
VLQEKKNTVGELNEQLAKVEQLKKERQGKEEKIVTLTNQLAEIEHGRQNLKFNLDEILERKMQRQKTLSKENKKINFYNSFTHIDPSQNPINAILKSARDGIVVSRIHDAHGEEYTIARDVESVISAPIKPYIDQLNELRRRFEKNKEKDAKDLFAVFNDVEDEDQKLLSSYQKIRSTQREREMKVIKNLENFINGQLEGIKETIDSSATQEAGELFKKVEKNLAGIREEISRLEKENKNDETLEKQITGQYMISQVESGKKENELNESKKSLQKLKDEIDISTSSTDITVGAISEIEKKISLLEQELVKCHEDQNRIKEDGKKLEQLLSLVNPIATNFEKIINQIEFIH